MKSDEVLKREKREDRKENTFRHTPPQASPEAIEKRKRINAKRDRVEEMRIQKDEA